jgi:endonuclease-3
METEELQMKLTPEIYFEKVPPSLNMEIRTELYHTNEFTFAVAVILSAQATDKKVNEVTPALFAIADTPEKMIKLGEDGLKEHIKVISFFNNKAKNILSLSRQLANRKQAGAGLWLFPSEYHNQNSLMSLPGIGQKTANVIMNVLWGAPTIGVDTHVFRNAHRYRWVSEDANAPEKVEVQLLKLIPEKYHAIASHVMVLHGRHICTALRPKCAQCPVAEWCDASDKTI